MCPFRSTELNPNKLLLDNYDYNRLLVKALMELFPLIDRDKVYRWVRRLDEMNHTPEQLLYRSHYMWLLLFLMQIGKLVPPFNRAPPIGQLRPLHEVLPSEIYQEIMDSAVQQKNQSWIDKLAKHEDLGEQEENLKAGLFPCTFLQNQPMPIEGAICYAAVFSDFPLDH